MLAISQLVFFFLLNFFGYLETLAEEFIPG